MDQYLDQTLSPEERAEDLLKKLSLEEKMAQLICCFPRDLDDFSSLEASTAYGIGQVSCLEMRMLESAEDCARFQRQYQQYIMARSPHHIPAIFHMEGLCGPLFQDTTSFPSGIGRASGWDTALEKQIGEIVGRQERAVGITQTLAPVLDVSRDPRMGRQGETYGEDPTLAAALGSAYTEGIQSGETDGRHTDAAAKHFLGFHQSAAGIHGAHCDIPSRPLREIFAKPFQAAITEADLKGVMPCYCTINGEPVHASRELLTGLLREEMGFQGVVVSDYGAVGNIHRSQHAAESMAEAGAAALEAGMDTELQVPECYNEGLLQRIRDGRVKEEFLDRSVRRVLTAKFRMGLFEHPYALTGSALGSKLHSPADSEISLQSARQSLILLKNDGTLPIARTVKKIAVIGCQAVNTRIFFGGYTHLSMAEGMLAASASMAGVEAKPWQDGVYTPIPGTPVQPDEEPKFDAVLRRQKPGCKSLLEQLRAELPDTEIVWSYGYPIAGNDCSRHDAALEAAKDADLILLTLGGKHGTSSIASMGEGVDASDIGLPKCQEVLIRRLKTLGIPMAGIHFNGRPISSDAADANLNAILEAWNPSEMGAQAIVDALLGTYNPSGKLPVTVARNAGQLPIYYNHPYGSSWSQGESIGFQNYVDLPHTPRYPFGFGLSYTSFAYSDLRLSRNSLSPRDTLEITCKIKNVGAMTGTEVIQFYCEDPFASMARPIQELMGFARVELEPGEEKTVHFSMRLSQLAFLDRNMRWKVEHGQINIRIGASSEDIRLKDSFTVTEDACVDGKTRGFWAEAVVK